MEAAFLALLFLFCFVLFFFFVVIFAKSKFKALNPFTPKI